MRLTRFLIVCTVFTAFSSSKEPCPSFRGERDALDFLAGPGPGAAVECQEAALRKLVDHKDPKSAPLLVRFLDVGHPIRTQEDRDRLGLGFKTISVAQEYPATAPLFNMDRGIVPVLVNVLGDESRSRTARSNAAKVLIILLSNERETYIRYVVMATKRVQDPKERDWLMELARRAAANCGQKEATCREELRK